MKNSMKKLCAIVLCLCLVLSLSACSNSSGSLVKPTVFNPDHENVDAESFMITDDNSKYELHWDKEASIVYIRDKVTGETYSNNPIDKFNLVNADGEPLNLPLMKSAIQIYYIDTTANYVEKTSNSYVGAANKGSYVIEKTPDNRGIKITYYFDKICISVPVVYTLLDDGIKISIDPREITETEELFLTKISVAPFFCSVPNVAEDTYLFYPSGTGAIINANNSSEVEIKLSAPIYGKDALQGFKDACTVSLTETVRLPVFGAVYGDRGLLGVISEGADIATLDANIGAQRYGASAVYPTFELRGYNYVSKVEGGVQYSKEYAYTDISVNYYPLSGENASYVGMADRYRKFLMEEKGMTDKDEVAGTALSFVGGTRLETSFLGMPTTEVIAATTITAMQDALVELNSKLELPIVSDFTGFGSSGIDPGQPAGNLEIAESIGNGDQMKALSAKCKELGIDLYLDYDMMHFNTDGMGLTITSGGSAKGPGYVYTRWYSYELGSSYSAPYTYLIGRAELSGIADKAADYTKSLEVGGISFRKITSRAYSDHCDNKYIGKANMGNDVSEIINNMKNSGLRFLASQANEYAAINADVIIDAPIVSSKFAVFDYDVPFYQLVFKGYTSLYGADVNMTTDRELTILRCIEGGSSLKYTLITQYSNELLRSAVQIFNSVLYEDNAEQIIEDVNGKNAAYYKAIEDAHIIDHVIINDDVRKVVYDNGVTVIVNYGEEVFESEIGAVAARDFEFVAKEGNANE